jgi:hypothetical protein
MEIATRLAADDPAKAEYHGDLSIGHNRIGIVLLSQGDAEGSLTELSAGLATSERLAALAVDDMTVQHNVAVSHLQFHYDGDHDRALRTRRQLARRGPFHSSVSHRLAVRP